MEGASLAIPMNHPRDPPWCSSARVLSPAIIYHPPPPPASVSASSSTAAAMEVVGLLGYVLGKLLEEKMRQALIISRGSFMTFVERPISAGLLLVALVILVVALLPSISKKRNVVFTENS